MVLLIDEPRGPGLRAVLEGMLSRIELALCSCPFLLLLNALKS